MIGDPLYNTARKEITTVADQGFPAMWLVNLVIGADRFAMGDRGWNSDHDRVTVRVGPWHGVFTRGMLSELSVTFVEWYELGEAALARWPLTFIEFMDIPGMGFQIVRGDNGWEVACGFQLRERGVRESDTDPEWWQIRETYSDRESMVEWVARDSYDLVSELNERLEE